VFERLALTTAQVLDRELDLDRLAIAVKPSDSRAKKYIADYGNRCWEVDVLPPDRIRAALDGHINSWLDRAAWDRRHQEIERGAVVAVTAVHACGGLAGSALPSLASAGAWTGIGSSTAGAATAARRPSK
jgi:hypothetical protein